MTEQEQIEQAQARAERAESAARRSEIQIEVLEMKADEFERATAARTESVASCAVQAMVRAGKIETNDIWTRESFRHQFIHDPGLIDLLFLNPANRRKI